MRHIQLCKHLFFGALFLSLIHISPVFAVGSQFTDVMNSHNNYVAITNLSENGILSGYEDGTFKPSKVVNRAEALKIILKGSGIEAPTDITETGFTDITADQWFAPFVVQAKQLGIVSGNPDGSFDPAANVKRAGFMKMLLETNKFKKDKWGDQQLYNDVPTEAWYAPYMNYAGKAGLIPPATGNSMSPDKELTRAEVSEILYLMRLILNGKQTQMLITQSEQHMVQIEVYIGTKNIQAAKRASELSYDLTQQALSNSPDNPIVLGAAKIAKAYDLLVDAYIAGLQKKSEEAKTLAEQTKVKATEAWEANNETQAIAKHIKERADEILNQL